MSGYWRGDSELALQFLERRYSWQHRFALHGSTCTYWIFFFSLDPHSSKLRCSKEGNWELCVWRIDLSCMQVLIVWGLVPTELPSNRIVDGNDGLDQCWVWHLSDVWQVAGLNIRKFPLWMVWSCSVSPWKLQFVQGRNLEVWEEIWQNNANPSMMVYLLQDKLLFPSPNPKQKWVRGSVEHVTDILCATQRF